MKARILVIEDEMAINDLLCMNLEAAGYETVGYLDGNDASYSVIAVIAVLLVSVILLLLGKLHKKNILLEETRKVDAH